ncbi:hypothetical protein [Actinoplanes awajinensis]|uniref:hypothetical protein n=1 Tax=Actinoplanes awajinensis TaxID=135946 RepID=UPI0012F8DDA9|nr:hypothetical protein [Actinoplanes awajinensis]
MTLTARTTSTDPDAMITCRITSLGKVVAEDTKRGAHAEATCSARTTVFSAAPGRPSPS